MAELSEKGLEKCAHEGAPLLSFADVHNMPSKTNDAQPTSGISQIRSDFEINVAKQGFIGRSYDWMKDHLGVSVSEDSNILKRAWSMGLNYDESSNAIRENLAKTEDPALAANSLRAYDHSQKNGVDTITSVAALAASFTKSRGATSFIRSIALGGATNAGLRYADGAYSRPLRDATEGGALAMVTRFPRGSAREANQIVASVDGGSQLTREASLLAGQTSTTLHKQLSEVTSGTTHWLISDPRTSAEALDQLSRATTTENLIAIGKHRNTSPETLGRLAEDMYPSVRRTVAEHSQTSDETLWNLSHDPAPEVRAAVADNPNVSTQTLRDFYRNDFFTSDIARAHLQARTNMPLPRRTNFQ